MKASFVNNNNNNYNYNNTLYMQEADRRTEVFRSQKQKLGMLNILELYVI